MHLKTKRQQSSGRGNETANRLVERKKFLEGNSSAVNQKNAGEERMREHPVRSITVNSLEWPESFNRVHPTLSTVFLRGHWRREKPWVGVVGARASDTYGETVAYRIGKALGEMGIPLCTGGARGIDSAAIQGALDGNGEVHVVFGTSIEQVAGGPHRYRFERVLKNGGSWLSEQPEGSQVRPYHFRNRNRMIAALSKSLVVVQAASRSGSLSTARWARSLGCSLWAVPGDLNKSLAAGTNRLVAEGKARPLVYLSQLFEEISFHGRDCPTFPPSTDPRHGGVGQRWLPHDEPTQLQSKPHPISPVQQTILSGLKRKPMTAEDCAQETGLSCDVCRASLEILELEGYVRRLVDERFVAEEESQ